MIQSLKTYLCDSSVVTGFSKFLIHCVPSSKAGTEDNSRTATTFAVIVNKI